MMDVQLNSICEHLRSNDVDVIKMNFEKMCIDIKIKIRNIEYVLSCTLTNGFPYEFPLIRVEKGLIEGELIPHLSSEGNICIFDSNIVVPDFNNPNEIVLATINRAVKILHDGVNGSNKQDLLDEIKAYWEVEAQMRVFLFSELGAKAKTLKCIIENGIYYVSDDIHLLIDYFRFNFNITLKDKNIGSCLYLPFRKQWTPPYPRNFDELHRMVAEDEYCKANYESFIKNNNKDNIILFSNMIDSELFLGAWFQYKLDFPKKFGIEQLNFRLLSIPPNSHKPIYRCHVVNLNKDRTFRRGGDGTALLDYSVNVIGCGSIGSYLVEALRELGVFRFNLIDNDVLTDENVARHMAGASYIYRSKVEAIERIMIQKNPGIKISSQNMNVFDVIKNDVQIFNNVDLNFLVVGNIPIEIAFINLLRELVITSPIAIIWVEPYLIGAHIMFLKNSQHLDSIINDYIEKYSILMDSHKYLKREAGCQGTYVPYSAFKIKKFLYSTLDILLERYSSRQEFGNCLISWTGDLNEARRTNKKLSDEWLIADNYKVRIEELK